MYGITQKIIIKIVSEERKDYDIEKNKKLNNSINNFITVAMVISVNIKDCNPKEMINRCSEIEKK